MGNAVIIKLILILLLLVMFAVYRSVSAGRHAMGRFMPFIALLLASLAVIFPGLTQYIARFVGITYGANLVVYLTIMGLLMMVVAMRGGQAKQARDITLLARKIAIDEARPANKKD